MNFQEPISGLVERIARALERLAPPSPRKPDFDRAEAFIWQADPEAFLPVAAVNRVPLSLLKGIDRMRDVLFDNTVRFAQGLPANNLSEGIDETVSLSDRFGLWIGFHNCSQDEYLDMVRGYAAHYRLPIEDEVLAREALAWAIGRGARSGRVAFQYIQDVAGRLGVRLDGEA